MTTRSFPARRRGVLVLACASALTLGGFAAVPVTQAIAEAAPTATASASAPASAPSCTVKPADPNATDQAKKLLCYLYSQYGNHVLSGQQESIWNGGPEYEMNHLFNTTGKHPAIRGLDMRDRPGAVDRAIGYWKAGGIPMMAWTLGAPTKTDDYVGSQDAISINATLTTGTAEYVSFVDRLNQASVELLRAQDAKVAVVWRPFHEAGGTWFWWSKEGGAQYVRLWKFAFDYLTRQKGVHNLVWLHPYNGFPDTSFFPGNAYVDLGGADTYAKDHGPLTEVYNQARTVYDAGMPIALHESGPIPDPVKAKAEGAQWVLFCTFNGEWLTEKNDTAFLKSVYSSEYVITRDELPSLK